jgi:hypothetical protein
MARTINLTIPACDNDPVRKRGRADPQAWTGRR